MRSSSNQNQNNQNQIICKYVKEEFIYKYAPTTNNIQDLCTAIRQHFHLGSCKFIGLKLKSKPPKNILNDQKDDHNGQDYSRVLLSECTIPSKLMITGTQAKTLQSFQQTETRLQQENILMSDETHYNKILMKQNQHLMQFENEYAKLCANWMTHTNLDTLTDLQRQQLVEYKIIQNDLAFLSGTSVIGGQGKLRIDLTTSMIIAIMWGRENIIDFLFENEVEYVKKCRDNHLHIDDFEPLTIKTISELLFLDQPLVDQKAKAAMTTGKENKEKLTASVNRWINRNRSSNRYNYSYKKIIPHEIETEYNNNNNQRLVKETHYMFMACKYGHYVLFDRFVKEFAEIIKELDINFLRTCVRLALINGHLKFAKAILLNERLPHFGLINKEKQKARVVFESDVPLCLHKGYFDSAKYLMDIVDTRMSEIRMSEIISFHYQQIPYRINSAIYFAFEEIVVKERKTKDSVICGDSYDGSSNSSIDKNNRLSESEILLQFESLLEYLINLKPNGDIQELTSSFWYRLLIDSFKNQIGVLSVECEEIKKIIDNPFEIANQVLNDNYGDQDLMRPDYLIYMKIIKLMIEKFHHKYKKNEKKNDVNGAEFFLQDTIQIIREKIICLNGNNLRTVNNYTYKANNFNLYYIWRNLLELETKYTSKNNQDNSDSSASLLNYPISNTNIQCLEVECLGEEENKKPEDHLIVMKKESKNMMDMSLSTYLEYHNINMDQKIIVDDLDTNDNYGDISNKNNLNCQFPLGLQLKMNYISTLAKETVRVFNDYSWSTFVNSIKHQIKSDAAPRTSRIDINHRTLTYEFIMPIKKLQYLISMGCVPCISFQSWSKSSHLKCLAIAHLLQKELEAKVNCVTQIISTLECVHNIASFAKDIISKYLVFYENRRVHENEILQHFIPCEIYQEAVHIVKLIYALHTQNVPQLASLLNI
jgi:hypothetical protein